MRLAEAIEVIHEPRHRSHSGCGSMLAPIRDHGQEDRWRLYCYAGYSHGPVRVADLRVLREAMDVLIRRAAS